VIHVPPVPDSEEFVQLVPSVGFKASSNVDAGAAASLEPPPPLPPTSTTNDPNSGCCHEFDPNFSKSNFDDCED